MRDRVTRSAGFTLLETLVALVVLGLMLVFLTKGAHFGLRAGKLQAHIDAGSGDIMAANRALRRMIEIMDPGDGSAAPIVATRDQLEFVTVLPRSAPMGSPERVQAALMVDSSHRLILRWWPHPHSRGLTRAPRATVTELLPDVSGLELAFWQRTGGWIDSWNYPELPALIRVRVLFTSGDSHRWPDLVAAPMLEKP